MSVGDGLVVVDKPSGMTSHDVVARIRRLAGTRKVGHAGTLDPMATGVLLIGLNRATRLLGHLQVADKTYEATIRLGVATTTDDAEGEVVGRSDASDLTDEQIAEGLARMVGEIDQVPSSVSAIKVDGKRAYARVRAGEQVELKARRVRIDAVDIHGIERGASEHLIVVDVDVTVTCSTGTYIRAIARDLGEGLGVGGHLIRLRRTSVGPFGIADAHGLDALAERFEMITIDEVARCCFPSLTLTEAQARDVRVGRRLALSLAVGGPVALFAADGGFLALYEAAPHGARAVAVFSA